MVAPERGAAEQAQDDVVDGGAGALPVDFGTRTAAG